MDKNGKLKFPKTAVLSRSADFAAVFRNKKSSSDMYLLIYGKPNELGFSRIGISVGRKFGCAVKRNKAKRLIREAFRLNRAELPQGFDWVIVPRVVAKASLGSYVNSMRTIMHKVEKRWVVKDNGEQR